MRTADLILVRVVGFLGVFKLWFLLLVWVTIVAWWVDAEFWVCALRG